MEETHQVVADVPWREDSHIRVDLVRREGRIKSIGIRRWTRGKWEGEESTFFPTAAGLTLPYPLFKSVLRALQEAQAILDRETREHRQCAPGWAQTDGGCLPTVSRVLVVTEALDAR
jgi:hypothetical protein